MVEELPSEGSHTEYVRKFLEYLEENKLPLTIKEMEAFKGFDKPGEDGNLRGEWKNSVWQDFLKNSWGYKLHVFKEAGNANFQGLEVVKLKDLTVKHIDKPIELEECSISTISPNEMMQKSPRYICANCGNIWQFKGERMPKKIANPCCGDDMEIVEDTSANNMIDAQWLRVQETVRDASQSKIPISKPVLVKGDDMIWQIGFNERIKPKGLMRIKIERDKATGGKKYTSWFEMFAFEKTAGVDEEIEWNDEIIARIEEEMKKPGYWDKLVRSFCPWIHDQYTMKEVVLLGLGSMKTESPLRILIIGDPSTGKSDVLKAANMLPAQKHYAIMKQSRGTGLTVTSVKDPDTDQWTVEPGEFVWADEWCLIIDEFQAGHEKDVDGLNSVIWDHKIPYNLAGGVRGEFKARCVLIFACNPQTGRMAKEENIFVLLKFIGEKTLPAFISRMSFILYVEESNDKKFHRKVAEKIYDNWSEEEKKKHFWEDWYDEIDDEYDIEVIDGVSHKVHTTEERFGIKTLQQILKYVTEKVVLTKLPPEYKDRFVDYYSEKRDDPAERSNKIITPRYMKHLLGIAQNHGRWHGRGAPNEEDMEYAFKLMKEHMTIAATDPKTGDTDAGMLNGNLPESRMREIELEQVGTSGKGKQIDWACKKAGALHSDEYFTIDELQDFLKQLGVKNKWKMELELMKWLNDSQRSGTVIKKDGEERYRWDPKKGVMM